MGGLRRLRAPRPRRFAAAPTAVSGHASKRPFRADERDPPLFPITHLGRRWLELSVRCPSAGDRAALLADGLVSLGARGVEERGGWYVSYFAEPDDVSTFVRGARASLTQETGLSAIQIEHAWQLHEDWAETWKRGLAPRKE